MKIINFSVMQGNKTFGVVAIRNQAVNAAKAIAKQTGKPVSVVAKIADGRIRKVIYNPNGTIEKKW